MADEDEPACNLSGQKRKRGLAVIEPPQYRGDIKTCPECGSTEDSIFKYLNNGKRDQPRYRCLKCKHMHTHYPPDKKSPRPHACKTYKKHTLANPPDHCHKFDLRCPNPDCEAENRKPRFLYYNNNKNNKNPLQPRYRCLVCNVRWQPKLKAKLPAPPDTEGVPTQADYDHKVNSCHTTESAAPIDMQEFVASQQTFNYNPEIDSANLGPGDPTYLCMMQAEQQPPYGYPADQIENVRIYPDGDQNYMDAMQGLQSQQQYYATADPLNSMGSCTEYVANVNHTMQGVDQPYSESPDQYVNVGGADANFNHMMQVQQPYSEISQEYFVNNLERTHDPSISYIDMLQASDPNGHISVQAGDQKQSYHPEECFASSDTVHVDASYTTEAGVEQSVVFPELDSALGSGTYVLNAPEDKDQWMSEDIDQWMSELSELIAVDG